MKERSFSGCQLIVVFYPIGGADCFQNRGFCQLHINTTVEKWAKLSEKLLPYRKDYDAVWGGPGQADPDIVQKLLTKRF